MKTTTENNKLIAEFMGVHSTDNKSWFDGLELHKAGLPFSYGASKLKFHSSWDWLMPVIENIDHLEYESERLNKIDNAIKTRSIVDTCQAVVEFIKWYNKNNK